MFTLFAHLANSVAHMFSHHAVASMGCVNSPECPTAVLAAVGAAGAGLVQRFKR